MASTYPMRIGLAEVPRSFALPIAAMTFAVLLTLLVLGPSTRSAGEQELVALGQVGGASLDLEISGDMAFLAEGSSVQVLGDLDSTEPSRRGRSPDLGGMVTTVLAEEDLLVAAVRRAPRAELVRFKILPDGDLRPTGSLTMTMGPITAMARTGHLLFAAGGSRLLVVDIRDHAFPRLLESRGLQTGNHALQIEGNTLWLITHLDGYAPTEPTDVQVRLRAFDVDPSTGSLSSSGTLDLPRSLHRGIVRSKTHLIVSDADHLYLLDPNDPGAPRISTVVDLAALLPGLRARAVVARGDQIAISALGPGSQPQIHIVDLMSMRVQSTISGFVSIGSMAYADSVLYVDEWEGPLWRLEPSVDGEVRRRWRYDRVGRVCTLAQSGDLVALTSWRGPEEGGGLSILRFGDEAGFELVGQLPGIGSSLHVLIHRQQAILSGRLEGPVLVDLEDPSAPVEIANLGLDRPLGIAVDEDHLLVGTGNALYVFDLTGTEGPIQTQRIDFDGGAFALLIDGSWLFALDTDSERLHALPWDHTSGEIGSSRRTFDFGDIMLPKLAAHDGRLYAMAQGARLFEFDLADPIVLAPQTYDLIGGTDFAVADGRLWLASAGEDMHDPLGLHDYGSVGVLDLDDLDRAEPSTHAEAREEACSIHAAGRRAFLGDGYAGLVALELRDRATPTSTASSTPSPRASDVPTTPGDTPPSIRRYLPRVVVGIY